MLLQYMWTLVNKLAQAQKIGLIRCEAGGQDREENYCLA
jgi:hypothetical protein